MELPGKKAYCRRAYQSQTGRTEKRYGVVVAIFCGMALSCASQIAGAEDAPKGNKGFTVPKSQIVDLAPEIEGMTGRQLRMRVLKIEPGGYIGLHTHKNRQAVVYFRSEEHTS